MCSREKYSTAFACVWRCCSEDERPLAAWSPSFAVASTCCGCGVCGLAITWALLPRQAARPHIRSACQRICTYLHTDAPNCHVAAFQTIRIHSIRAWRAKVPADVSARTPYAYPKLRNRDTSCTRMYLWRYCSHRSLRLQSKKSMSFDVTESDTDSTTAEPHRYGKVVCGCICSARKSCICTARHSPSRVVRSAATSAA